jgi:putative endonuclease
MYVIECQDGSLYAGIALDPHKRFAIHKAGRGAKYTRARGVSSLVWTCEIGEQRDALRFEAAFKRLTRSQKLHFLAQVVLLTAETET